MGFWGAFFIGFIAVVVFNSGKKPEDKEEEKVFKETRKQKKIRVKKEKLEKKLSKLD